MAIFYYMFPVFPGISCLCVTHGHCSVCNVTDSRYYFIYGFIDKVRTFAVLLHYLFDNIANYLFYFSNVV